MFSNFFDRDKLYANVRKPSICRREASLKESDALDTRCFCMKQQAKIAMANLFGSMAIIREHKYAAQVLESLL